MSIIAVVNQIIMLFIVAAIGAYMSRRKVLTGEVVKGLNSLVLQVAWPAMILMTTQKECTDERLHGFICIACVTTVILAVMCIALFFFVKSRGMREDAVFTMLAAMPNAGFVGLPILQVLYGDLGILYLAAFLVGFNLVLWTIGVFLFSGINLQSIHCLINVGFISTVIGTILFLAHVSLPTPLLSTVNLLGSLTTPLAMLLLGAHLSELQVRQLANPRLLISIAIKLLALPLLTLVIMKLLRADAVVTGVTVLAMAMPSASAAQIFAEKYERDVQFAVQGVSLSMLLCIITIPLILVILQLS